MSVSIHRTGGEELPETLRAKLIAAAQILLNEHHLEQGDVAVVLTDDAMLLDLNRRYLDLDYPTDVLSFPMLEPGAAREETAPGDYEVLVGDIYISLQRAREQAGAAGHSWEREVLILAIHGLLHLLGYDHDGGAAAEAMQQKEVEILDLAEQLAG